MAGLLDRWARVLHLSEDEMLLLLTACFALSGVDRAEVLACSRRTVT